MKKFILGLIIVNLFIICSFGQDSYIKGRLNFKTGYARYFAFNQGYKGNYRIEANYGVSKYIELGAYIGYSRFKYSRKISPDSSNVLAFRSEPNNTMFYGANLNFHLFPLIVKEDDFRFDLYGTAKAGGLYFQKPYYIFVGQYPVFILSNKRMLFEYGFGGGLSFYLGKHLGLYTEYTFGRYYLHGNHQLRYGLTLKF